MQFINELNSYLQVCLSLEETHSIIEHYAKKIFADYTGVLACSKLPHGGALQNAYRKP